MDTKLNANQDSSQNENIIAVQHIISPTEYPQEQVYFLDDALILIDTFFRTISGIRDIRSYLTIFRSEETPLFTLRDQKLVASPSNPLINYLITEVVKSGATILFNDLSPKSSEHIWKPSGSSWLISPLFSNNQIIGAILIQGPKNGPYFAESDKQILTSLTEPISNLFQNVFRLQSTRKTLDTQYQEVQTLGKIQEDLAKLTDKLLETLDVDLVLQTSVVELREMFGLAEVEIQLIAE